jgi:hypothetical protein
MKKPTGDGSLRDWHFRTRDTGIGDFLEKAGQPERDHEIA